MRYQSRIEIVWKTCGVVVAAACTVAGCTGGEEAGPGTAATKPIVTVVETGQETGPLVVSGGNGTTRDLEQVAIRARVKGFLTEKHFKEGENVKKDQLLLVIEKKPFE